ncbi:MAG: TAXI family TRAP transporter solute-binding subunit [Verrucomicrobiota bacterium]
MSKSVISFSDFKNWIRTRWLIVLVVATSISLFVITYQYVEPAPPSQLTIAAGPNPGGYYYFAEKYADILERNGITVTIRETKGSLENLQLLHDPDSDVDVVLAQGGVGWMAGVYDYLPTETDLRSIAEVYYEPLWIFTLPDLPFYALRDLQGKRLTTGPEGSGSNALAYDMLKWSGVTVENSTLTHLSEADAVLALESGEVDAAFFVAASGSPFIQKLMAREQLRLHSFNEVPAFLRRYGYLSPLTLPESVLDLARNIPDEDIQLLAPTTTLITRETLHPALVYLLIETAAEVHGGHDIFSNLGEFPNINNIEFPPHEETERYFEHGAPFLQRFLPYHIAVFIDRTKILLLPLLTLILPLVRIIYPTYRWSVRRNIWKWYRVAHQIEKDLVEEKDSTQQLLERLEKLKARVLRLKVPPAYSGELYHLRHHLLLIKEEILRRKK